jgi:WD40 repeat protein
MNLCSICVYRRGFMDVIRIALISTMSNALVSGEDLDQASFQILKVGKIDALDWSPDSKLLAVNTKSHMESREGPKPQYTVTIWAVSTRMPQKVMIASAEPIQDVAFSPNGQQVACGIWIGRRDQSAIFMWDVDVGQQLPSLVMTPEKASGVQCSSDILCIAFSPDGRYAAAGTKLVDQQKIVGRHIGGEVIVWDVKTRRLNWSNRTTHTDMVNSVAFSPNNELLATGGNDKLIRIWRPNDGKLVRTLFGAGWDGVISLAFSPDSKLLASGGQGEEESGYVRVWDVESGDLQHVFTGDGIREGAVRIAFSPGGDLLYALGQSETDPMPKWQLRAWNPHTGKPTGRLCKGRGFGRALTVAPSGEEAAIGTAEGEVVLVRLSKSSTQGKTPTVE